MTKMDYQQLDNLTESEHHHGHQPGWAVPVSLVSALSSIYIASLLVHYYYYKCPGSIFRPASGRVTGSTISIDKTQMIPARISHHRLIPASHGFTYPYLSVGIPVRSPTSNWLFSTDGDGVGGCWNRGWLHVSAKHHLYRGRDGSTLSENLDGYLRDQGLDPSEYPHAYLVTAPSLLGYRFSPASFWYLYTSERRLGHVIAEVNNTFSERRMYLFSAPEQDPTDTGKTKFRQTHDKDFHVSPFSSRKGSYVLSTLDPAEHGQVSITTTLRSSKGATKLVARWWSDEALPAIDPAQISVVGALWLLLSWGWGIMVTYPRIVFQAIWLAQVRKLHIWYRPEPRESAVPRAPTASEEFLGSVLARYVDHVLETRAADCHLSLSMSYPGVDGKRLQRSYGSSAQECNYSLRIHAPQFYRRMITYGSLSHLLQDTLLDTHNENRSAWSDHGDDAEELVAAIRGLEELQKHTRTQAVPQLQPLAAYTLNTLWSIHSHLRGGLTPLLGSYPDGLPSTRSKNKVDEKQDPGPAANVTLTDPQAETWPRAAKRGGGVSVSSGSHGTETRRICFLDEFIRKEGDGVMQMRYMLATLLLQWRTTLMGILGGE